MRGSERQRTICLPLWIGTARGEFNSGRSRTGPGPPSRAPSRHSPSRNRRSYHELGSLSQPRANRRASDLHPTPSAIPLRHPRPHPSRSRCTSTTTRLGVVGASPRKPHRAPHPTPRQALLRRCHRHAVLLHTGPLTGYRVQGAVLLLTGPLPTTCPRSLGHSPPPTTH